MFAKLEPFEDAGNGNRRQLVKARCDGAKALQPVEQPLDDIAFPIEGPIIVVWPSFIRATGNHHRDLPFLQPGAQVIVAVAPITDQARKPQPLLGRLPERNRLGLS